MRLIVAVVEVVSLKQHLCVIVFHMYALIHQNMYFGIQYTLQRRHTITYSSQTATFLMPSSTARIPSYPLTYYIFFLLLNFYDIILIIMLYVLQKNNNNVVCMIEKQKTKMKVENETILYILTTSSIISKKVNIGMFQH